MIKLIILMAISIFVGMFMGSFLLDTVFINIAH